MANDSKRAAGSKASYVFKSIEGRRSRSTARMRAARADSIRKGKEFVKNNPKSGRARNRG